MYLNLSFLVLLGFLILHVEFGALGFTPFIYNGFKQSNLTLDGAATISSNGLLQLTDETNSVMGHAFHPNPIPFRQSQNDTVLSFSTTFVFAIVPKNNDTKGHGLVFVISPTKAFSYSLPTGYLGIFNQTNIGNSSNHVVGVEFDTNLDYYLDDINNNHVGIDINNPKSVESAPARYNTTTTSSVNILLWSGKSIQAWVEYDGLKKEMHVTIAPTNINKKPTLPLLSLSRDLSSIFNDTMYVGFSSANGASVASHYIRGWSFALNTTTPPPLDIPNLPMLPKPKNKRVNMILKIGLPIMSALLVTIAICVWVFYTIQRKKRFSGRL